MSKLPLTTVPSSTVELPVLKKTVRVRAMNIREEKNLLTAKDAGNSEDIEFCITELIKECTYGSVDFESLTDPDVIAIFLKIVELSKGSTCVHTYVCHNMVDGQECLAHINVEVDLRKVKFDTKNVSNLVTIQDGITVELQYPTNEIYKKVIKKAKTEVEAKLMIFAFCIKSVMQGDSIYTEYTDEEIYNWLLDMNEESVKKIAAFFDSTPKASLSYDIVCPKCGYKETVILTDLEDFFGQDIPGNPS